MPYFTELTETEHCVEECSDADFCFTEDQAVTQILTCEVLGLKPRDENDISLTINDVGTKSVNGYVYEEEGIEYTFYNAQVQANIGDTTGERTGEVIETICDLTTAAFSSQDSIRICVLPGKLVDNYDYHITVMFCCCFSH